MYFLNLEDTQSLKRLQITWSLKMSGSKEEKHKVEMVIYQARQDCVPIVEKAHLV